MKARAVNHIYSGRHDFISIIMTLTNYLLFSDTPKIIIKESVSFHFTGYNANYNYQFANCKLKLHF